MTNKKTDFVPFWFAFHCSCENLGWNHNLYFFTMNTLPITYTKK